ncbi:MAG: hypothetical protein Q9M97_01995 [Candidatus Gracilibacteria bacterium]|nr:hypothetical protein [Candidatus Gracilibacteria bacterium]
MSSYFLELDYGVSITGVEGRNLTFEWSFEIQPAGSNIVLSDSSGNISADGSLFTTFTVKKLGTYTLKIILKDDGNIIGTGTTNFTINN